MERSYRIDSELSFVFGVIFYFPKGIKTENGVTTEVNLGICTDKVEAEIAAAKWMREGK